MILGIKKFRTLVFFGVINTVVRKDVTLIRLFIPNLTKGQSVPLASEGVCLGRLILHFYADHVRQ